MKLFLQSADRYLEYGEFDVSSGMLQRCTKTKPVKTSGSYSFVENALVAIFAHQGSVSLRVGESSLGLKKEHRATINQTVSLRKLVIFDGSTELLSFQYSAPIEIPDDVTTLVDKEDNDFCLFVANIVNSAERQAILVENSMRE